MLKYNNIRIINLDIFLILNNDDNELQAYQRVQFGPKTPQLSRLIYRSYYFRLLITKFSFNNSILINNATSKYSCNITMQQTQT